MYGVLTYNLCSFATSSYKCNGDIDNFNSFVLKEEKQMKSVSVVMCTYNGAKYLKEQIESIIAQTYPLKEIIIQDDGSTDETCDIAKEYATRYSNLVVCSNEGEHGVNNNFLSAIRRATGDYIAISDQDDIWRSDKIEQQISAIGNNLLCSHLYHAFSEEGKSLFLDTRLPNYNLLRLLYCAEIPGHTMLIRRSILDILPENSELYAYRCYDIILSVAAAAYNSIAYVELPLVNHRRYEDAYSYTDGKETRATAYNAIRILWWSIKYYRRIKHLSLPNYQRLHTFLQCIGSEQNIKYEGMRMLELQMSFHPLDFLRLQRFCIRHRREIFHTKETGLRAVIRALLFPIMSGYYQRLLITS